jgi:hypothetical protein
MFALLRLIGTPILSSLQPRWSSAWALPLYTVPAGVLGMLFLYVALGIAHTVRRCFRHWKRCTSRSRGSGEDVEMRLKHAAGGIAHVKQGEIRACMPAYTLTFGTDLLPNAQSPTVQAPAQDAEYLVPPTLPPNVLRRTPRWVDEGLGHGGESTIYSCPTGSAV